jgi:elongation factor 2
MKLAIILVKMAQTSEIRNIAVVEFDNAVSEALKIEAGVTCSQEERPGPVLNTVLHHSTNSHKYHINLLESATDKFINIVDGVVIILDCTRQLKPQTTKQIENIDKEQIESVLMLDNIDEILHYTPQTFYAMLKHFLDALQTQCYTNRTLIPNNGTICFGSSKHKWAFTIPQIAKLYSKKFLIEETKLCSYFWGDHYYNSDKKVWTTTNTGTDTMKHGFEFVYDMIQGILNAAKVGGSKIDSVLQTLDVRLPHKKHSELFHAIMSAAFPLEQTILDMICVHLPSPIISQRKRCLKLYSGPSTDIFAKGIQNCDPSGPVMFHVANKRDTKTTRVYFGRLFSGIPTNEGMIIVKPSTNQIPIGNAQFYIPNGKHWESIKVPTPGQVLCIVSGMNKDTDNDMGTITNSDKCGAFRGYAHTRPFYVMLETTQQALNSYSTLVQHVRHVLNTRVVVGSHNDGLSLESDSCLALQKALIELKRVAGDTFIETPILVQYRETVTTAQTTVAMSKSPNKHNRYYMTCQPLDDEQSTTPWLQTSDVKMIDCTKDKTLLDEIKDYTQSALNWFSREGVLVGEPVIGVQFNLIDVIRAEGSMGQFLRGGGQFLPPARRCMYACQLLAEPRLMQAIMNTTTVLAEHLLGEYYVILNKCNGVITSCDVSTLEQNVIIVQSTVPATNCCKFEQSVAKIGECYNLFSHWEIIPGLPLHDANVMQLVKSIRISKGLVEQIPSLDRFLDRL